ncbi:hypothetical protein D3C78_579760 [compost metagenome]
MQGHEFFVDRASLLGIARKGGFAQISHFARGDVGGNGDVAFAAQQDQLDRGRIIAGQHDEVLADAIEDGLGALEVAGRFLDTDDVRHGGQADHGLGLHVAGGAARNVVEDLRDVDGFGNVLEVLVQAFLGRLVVVRHHQQAGVGASVLGVAGQVHGFSGGVRAGAGDHRNRVLAVLDALDHVLDNQNVLFDIQGRGLTGGADCNDRMGAVFQVEVYKFVEAVPIKTPLCIHGCDQCHHTARNHETAPAGKRER